MDLWNIWSDMEDVWREMCVRVGSFIFGFAVDGFLRVGRVSMLYYDCS